MNSPIKHTMHTQRGLTLVELLVSLAVFSILVAIAAPNFSRTTTVNYITTEANTLRLAFVFARDEAINRNADIAVISRNATGTTAIDSTNNWNNGWVVQLAAAPNTVLSQAEPMPTAVRIPVGTVTATFRSDGSVSTALAVGFCDKTTSSVATPGPVLQLLASGRLSVLPNVSGTCPAYP